MRKEFQQLDSGCHVSLVLKWHGTDLRTCWSCGRSYRRVKVPMRHVRAVGEFYDGWERLLLLRGGHYSLLKIIDAEVMIGGEGFTRRSGATELRQSLY